MNPPQQDGVRAPEAWREAAFAGNRDLVHETTNRSAPSPHDGRKGRGADLPTPVHAVFGLKEGAETVAPLRDRAKGQRGGSYINSPYRLRATFRTKGDPTEHDPHVGFRCAQDAPPLPDAGRAERP